MEPLERRELLAVLYWDPVAGGGVGGSGTWDTNAEVWNTAYDGTGDRVALTANDEAHFTNTSGTVTVSGTVSAAAMNFLVSGYSLTPQNGNALIAASTDLPITVASGCTTTIGTVIDGSGGLTKSGAGTLILSNVNNSFTGGTTISAGILQLGTASSQGFVPGDIIDNGTLVLFNNSTLTAQTYAGDISGNGAVENRGPGPWILSGSNSYSGGTVIGKSSKIELGSSSALPAGWGVTLASNNATLDLHNYSAQIGALSGPAGSYITLGTGTLTVGSGSWGGIISGAGNLTKNTGSTLTLSNDNTFTGLTTIENGILQFAQGMSGGGSNCLSTSGAITATGSGILDLGTYSQTTSGNVSIEGGTIRNGTLSKTGGVFAAQSGTVSAALTGTAGLTKTTGGTLTLSGSNSYTGATTISEGTLRASSSGALPSGTSKGNVTVNSSLELTSTVAVNGLFGSGTVTSSTGSPTFWVGYNNQSSTFTGTIEGTIALRKTGTGTLTLDGANTYTGSTTISNGTLTFGTGGQLPSGTAVSLANLATASLNLNNTSQIIGTLSGGGTAGGNVVLGTGELEATGGTYSGSISGIDGSLVKTGTGEMILLGTNSYSGGTTVSDGTLQIGNGGATGSIAGNVDLSSATSVLAFNLSSSPEFSGVISGSGGLLKSGTGTLILTGSNTYTGSTTIMQGTIQASDLDSSDGSSNLGNSSDKIQLGGESAGQKGVLSYVGDSATFTRGFNVRPGGGEVDIAGSGQTLTLIVDTYNLWMDGLLTVGGAGNMTFTSSADDAGGYFFDLWKTGTGTLTLNYTGAYYFWFDEVTVDSGRLEIQGNALFTSVTIATGSTLEISDTLDLSSPITNQGTLILRGDGQVRIGPNPTIYGDCEALSGTELYATWIGFDRSEGESNSYISLDDENYYLYATGAGSDTAVLISDLTPGTTYYVRVVLTHTSGGTEIYESEAIATLTTDTSGWYRVGDLTLDDIYTDPVNHPNPIATTPTIVSALVPSATVEAIGAPYAWGYAIDRGNETTSGLYEHIYSWVYAGSKQGAVLQSILGLVKDGTMPTLNEDGQVIIYHNVNDHGYDFGYSFVPDGGVSAIIHYPYEPDIDGPIILDPDDPCECPPAGGDAGTPDSGTGGSVFTTNSLDNTGGCAPCGAANSGLAYTSRGSTYDFGFGTGWCNASDIPVMVPGRNTVVILTGNKGNKPVVFDTHPGGGFDPRYCLEDSLTHDTVNDVFVYTTKDGTRYEFFDDEQTTHPAGAFSKSVSPSGASVEVAGWTASGKIAQVLYKKSPTSLPHERRDYAPVTVDNGTEEDLELIGSVTLYENHATVTPVWNGVRKTTYDYYEYGDSFGLPGDLKTTVTQDWNGSSFTGNDTTYFRYYTDATFREGTQIGFAHGLKRVLLPNAYAAACIEFEVGSLDGVTETQTGQTGKTIANYTCFYYEYDADRRVTESVVFGQSKETEFDNEFVFNTEYNYGKGYNNWYRRSVETLRDSVQNVLSTQTVYTNFLGQAILTDLCDTKGTATPADDEHFITWNRYDGDGRVILTAEPSAFVTTGPWYSEEYADLINFAGGTSTYLKDTGGKFTVITYYDATTANIGEPIVGGGVQAGGVKGYPHQLAVAEGETSARLAIGEGGGPILLTSYEYTARWDGDATSYAEAVDDIEDGATIIYPVASKTAYRAQAGGEAVVTSYAYSWYNTAGHQLQMQEVVVTLPNIVEGQNGSGVASKAKVWYDEYGRLVWSMNEIGCPTYNAYDPLTGLRLWTIEDIDDNKAAALSLTPPTGWDLPNNSSGANLQTDYQYDALGRVIRVLGPVHQVDIGTQGTYVRSATWTVYKDTHETRTAQGYATESVPGSGNWNTFTIVGLVSITKTNPDGRVTDEIGAEYNGSPDGLATAVISQSAYKTWTAYKYKKTKLYQTAVYHKIPTDISTDRDANGNFMGTEGVGESHHYNVTTIGYESFGAAEYTLVGRQNKTVSPDGTITRYVLDARGNVLSTWVGTDDVPAFGVWSPTNTTDTDLVCVAEYAYDVNGNVVQSTQYLDDDPETDTDRVTSYHYDFRDRLVYTVNPTDEAGRTTFSMNHYDNLGRVVKTQTYWDDDNDIATAGPEPFTGESTPGDDRLLSQNTTSYDNRGRVYRSSTFAVDVAQANPVPGASLSADVWYDAAGRVIKRQDAGAQTFAKFVYDNLGRVTAQYVGYDVDGEVTGDLYNGQGNVTLNLGDDVILAQTQYAYDGAGNTLFVISRQRSADAAANDYGELEFLNSRSTYVGYWYDGLDRQIARGDYGDGDDQNLTPGGRAVHAPAWNNLIGILVNCTQYDAQGRVQSVFDALNHETQYTYDAAGRVTKTVQNYQDGIHTPGTNNATSDLDIVTTIEYTADGQVWKQTDTLGNTTTYEYGTTLSDSGVARNDLLLTVTYPDPDGASSLASPTTTYAYNRLGEIVTATISDEDETLTRKSTYSYDKLGRQITVTEEDPDGQPGGDIAPSTTIAYDVRGNVFTVTDALDHSNASYYDAWNRLQYQQDGAHFDPDNPDEGATEYTYYDTGAMHTLTDPNENTTTWIYDKLNRVIEEEDVTPDSRYYIYDGGLLSRSIDRNDRVIDYDYDRYGQTFHEYWYDDVTEADNDPSHSNPDYTIQTIYDKLGNLYDVYTWNASGDSQSAYTYYRDALGRAEQIDYGMIAENYGFPTIVMQQAFDGNGNRTQLKAFNDYTADFVNDYEYDRLGRMTRVTQTDGGYPVADKRVDFTYKADSQFDTITRYADLLGTETVATGTYGYDLAGRLTDLTYTFPTGSSPAPAYTWSWDEGNCITQFTSKNDTTAGYSYATVNYHYDAANQLATEDTTPAADYLNWAGWANVADEDYEYDANGNRINGDYEVGTDNQMAAGLGYTYVYDDEGNRTERFVWTDSDLDEQIQDNEKSDITEYSWDHRNRLTDVAHRAAFGEDADWTVHHEYDYMNRLIYRAYDPDAGGVQPVERTAYAFDGNQIALQFEKSGTGDFVGGDLAHRYLWGPAVDQLLADEFVDEIEYEPETRWTLGDNLNSIRDVAVYDAQADETTIVAHRVFNAFGVLAAEVDPATGQSTNVDCHLYYTGKLFDHVTGLQNNLNRWYEPATGKWISKDPIGFAADDPNLYRYCQNNPIFYVDPDGNAYIDPHQKAACEARVKELQVAVASLYADLERAKVLLKARAISPEDYDAILLKISNAENAVTKAQTECDYLPSSKPPSTDPAKYLEDCKKAEKELRDAIADLNTATTRLGIAQRAFDRAEWLRAHPPGIRQEDYDKAKYGLDAAKAAVERWEETVRWKSGEVRVLCMPLPEDPDWGLC